MKKNRVELHLSDGVNKRIEALADEKGMKRKPMLEKLAEQISHADPRWSCNEIYSELSRHVGDGLVCVHGEQYIIVMKPLHVAAPATKHPKKTAKK